jgi:hypothetical protein
MNTFWKVLVFVIFVVLVVFTYTQLTKRNESDFGATVDYLIPYNNITTFVKKYNYYYKRLFDIYIASRFIKPKPIKIIVNDSPDKTELIEYYNSIIDDINFFIDVGLTKFKITVPLFKKLTSSVSDTTLTKNINDSINSVIVSVEKTGLPPWYKQTIPIKKNK